MHDTNEPEPITLSPTARARRDDMLRELKGVVRARRRRRVAFQGALAATPLVLVAAVVLVLAAPPRQPSQLQAQASDDATNPAGITPPQTPTFSHVSYSTLTDEELLEQLRAAGYDAGIARLGTRVVVTGLPSRPEPSSSAPDQGPGADAAPSQSGTTTRHSV
ncbi:MAG: hypothetical protein R3B57_11525 [Phycisphaerales bacterium]